MRKRWLTEGQFCWSGRRDYSEGAGGFNSQPPINDTHHVVDVVSIYLDQHNNSKIKVNTMANINENLKRICCDHIVIHFNDA